MGWTGNGNIWGTAHLVPATASGEGFSPGEGWRLLEGCGGSLKPLQGLISEQRSQDPKPLKITIWLKLNFLC